MALTSNFTGPYLPQMKDGKETGTEYKASCRKPWPCRGCKSQIMEGKAQAVPPAHTMARHTEGKHQSVKYSD